jgi:hypothetical protein
MTKQVSGISQNGETRISQIDANPECMIAAGAKGCKTPGVKPAQIKTEGRT